MRTVCLFVALVIVPSGIFAQKNKGKKNQPKELKLETFEDKLSYGIGHDVGHNLRSQGIEVNIEAFIQGFIHSTRDTAGLMTHDEMMAIFQEFQRKQVDKVGQGYIDEQIKKNPDLIKTNSGLVYKVLEQGTGPKPGMNNKVIVHYTGKTPDGTIFDSTEGNMPVTFPLNGLIPGWVEGLQLMNVGSKYLFLIPPDLGYGNNPPPNTAIRPGMTLIFEVELVGFE